VLGLDLGPAGVQLLPTGLQERCEERLPCREVAIEGARSEAGSLGDVLHCAADAVLGEELLRDVEDVQSVALRVGT
jgi:hypothetical protein